MLQMIVNSMQYETNNTKFNNKNEYAPRLLVAFAVSFLACTVQLSTSASLLCCRSSNLRNFEFNSTCCELTCSCKKMLSCRSSLHLFFQNLVFFFSSVTSELDTRESSELDDELSRVFRCVNIFFFFASLKLFHSEKKKRSLRKSGIIQLIHAHSLFRVLSESVAHLLFQDLLVPVFFCCSSVDSCFFHSCSLQILDQTYSQYLKIIRTSLIDSKKKRNT